MLLSVCQDVHAKMSDLSVRLQESRKLIGLRYWPYDLRGVAFLQVHSLQVLVRTCGIRIFL